MKNQVKSMMMKIRVASREKVELDESWKKFLDIELNFIISMSLAYLLKYLECLCNVYANFF